MAYGKVVAGRTNATRASSVVRRVNGRCRHCSGGAYPTTGFLHPPPAPSVPYSIDDRVRRLLQHGDGRAGRVARQATAATAGRVRVPRQGKEDKAKHAEEQRYRQESGRGWRQRPRWPQGRWSRRSKLPEGGERLRSRLLQAFSTLRRTGGSTGGGRGANKGDAGSRSSSRSRARICPTSHEDADGGGAVGLMAERPLTGMLVVRKPGDLDGGGADRLSTGEDSQLQEDGKSLGKNTSSEGGEEEGLDSDQISDGGFSLDMDVLDDVTNDEGFELGEVCSLLVES